MKTTRVLGLLAASVLTLSPGARYVRAADEVIVAPDRMGMYVAVRDVSTSADGTVSGKVANTSSQPIRDVRLLIRHTFLWKNEFHPGRDDPSQATYYTVPQEIPPGGQVPFTFRPESPLPRRTDGRFESDAQVAGATQMVTPGSAASRPGYSGSAESGTRGPADSGTRGAPESGTYRSPESGTRGAPGSGTAAPGD